MALKVLRRHSDDRSDHAAIVVSTAEDEARLRALVQAELERRYAKPLARRALSLMAEAALEPLAEDPGYRVVDRHGDPRYRPATSEEGHGKVTRLEAGNDEESLAPVTLAELVEELREKHPDLFSDPPPEPEPGAAHHSMQETMAHVRAAGARFVESQSALARSFAHSSAEGSRALASAASETLGQLRSRLKTRRGPASLTGEHSDAQPALSDAEAEQTSTIGTVLPLGRVARLRSAGARLGGTLRHSFSRLEPQGRAARAPGQALFERSSGRRAAFAGIGVLCVAALVGGAVLLSWGERPATPDPAPAQQAAPPASSSSAQTFQQDVPSASAPRAAQQSAVQPLSPNAAADPELQPSEPEEPPQSPNALTGVPEVIDTATLRVSGKLVPLFGVEWVRGGQAEELKKYLAGRSVSCQPAPGSSAFLCTVEGRDLSEVVLFNGGGRASPEATPDLVAAEDHARSERLGVWKR